MHNKKGQVVIFVIVAILIVVAVGFIFLIDRTPTVSRGQDFDNPESFIDNCIRDRAETRISALLQNGGFVNPTDYELFEGNKVTYLCKNINYYEACITQYPILINSIQQELNNELKSDAEQCFSNLESELTRRNYQVSGGDVTVTNSLKPNLVEINIERDFTMSLEDSSRTFNEFNTIVLSPVYDLVAIASEIVSQEAKYCYFSNDGFMLLYRNYDIRKTSVSEATKIYSITDKNTGVTMNIATRGCVIPAGF